MTEATSSQTVNVYRRESPINEETAHLHLRQVQVSLRSQRHPRVQEIASSGSIPSGYLATPRNDIVMRYFNAFSNSLFKFARRDAISSWCLRYFSSNTSGSVWAASTVFGFLMSRL